MALPHSVFGLLFLIMVATPVWPAPPRVFLLDSHALAAKKEAALGKQPSAEVRAWVDEIDRQARGALKVQILPVTSKEVLPPSGDKHDYMTQAPYFWPDPTKPNGLPYIRKDGERNPEIKKLPDEDLMNRMIGTVSKLALGYYATGNEDYAKRAAELLRLWFVDPATKMNPNLNFAQAVPGVNTGRGTGLIESRGLTRVVDAVGLLAGSRNWNDKDQKDVESWFGQFLDWMQTSKNGRDEANAKNNHGTYYDVQIASFALFVHKEQTAKSVLEAARTKRIAAEIEPDGRQPLELERTKSWSYSTMNLDGLLDLAVLGQSVGVDLWNYRTPDGRSIRRAIDYLYPYTRPGSKWPFKQIEPLLPERLYMSMRRAADHYTDVQFKQMMSTIPNGGNAN